jgi:2-polyprenyl-6-methoxyphenol hydroxylase-like FAD-dependent oxidoreductase
MTAWFTTAERDDLDDALERVAHQALMEFYECHLLGLDGTVVALLPIHNEGNTVWSERLAAVGDLEHETYHAGWAFTARYSQHMSSLLHEVMVTGAFQHLHLEEYDDRV